MRGHMRHITGLMAVLAVASCANSSFDRELGSETESGGFGNATMNNTLIQSGQKDYVIALEGRFSSEVQSTITFPFNSAELDGAARAALDQQANWIGQFPEVRFRVYGHTDLVGSDAYNKALGLRRAKAVVAYLGTRGISKSRLEALASFGKTQPVIVTQAPEVRNRRTVTEVSGFVENHPTVMNGKYAQVVWRNYVDRSGKTISLAERPHPRNTSIITQTDPSKP